MKKFLTIVLVLISPFITYGQNDIAQDSNSVFLEKFIQDYQKYSSGSRGFNLSASDSTIDFDTHHIVIESPYSKRYPMSYSIILNERLITLFEPGRFVCFNLETFERDMALEKQLNTIGFKYHWLFDGSLYAQSRSGAMYKWENAQWTDADIIIPLIQQPKLYDDDEFIVFGDCHGEWGGTVYFFDKKTHRTYYTESTCSNSVFKENDDYLVLAHLGHGNGFAELKSIPNPRNLTRAKNREINKTVDGQALGYQDKSMAYEKLLDLWSIQLFSTFKYRERRLFMVHLLEKTFLAEVDGKEIRIVHPLFKNEIYTHNSVTSTYGEYTLMNLDHYGTGREREISCIIIKGNKITKIDWNKNHSR